MLIPLLIISACQAVFLIEPKVDGKTKAKGKGNGKALGTYSDVDVFDILIVRRDDDKQWAIEAFTAFVLPFFF